MAYVAGCAVGAAILRALGIDPRGVRRFTIDVPADGVVTITVERLGTETLADKTTLAALAAAEPRVIETEVP